MDTVIVLSVIEGLLMFSVAIIILAAVGLWGHSVMPVQALAVIEAAAGLWLRGLGLGLVVSVANELVDELGNLVDMLMTRTASCTTRTR